MVHESAETAPSKHRHRRPAYHHGGGPDIRNTLETAHRLLLITCRTARQEAPDIKLTIVMYGSWIVITDSRAEPAAV